MPPFESRFFEKLLVSRRNCREVSEDLLIALRIAQGISQRELARRLGVHESQVSRDERNEYFGITLERAVKVLDALNVRLRTKVEIDNPPEMVSA